MAQYWESYTTSYKLRPKYAQNSKSDPVLHSRRVLQWADQVAATPILIRLV